MGADASSREEAVLFGTDPEEHSVIDIGNWYGLSHQPPSGRPVSYGDWMGADAGP